MPQRVAWSLPVRPCRSLLSRTMSLRREGEAILRYFYIYPEIRAIQPLSNLRFACGHRAGFCFQTSRQHSVLRWETDAHVTWALLMFKERLQQKPSSTSFFILHNTTHITSDPFQWAFLKEFHFLHSSSAQRKGSVLSISLPCASFHINSLCLHFADSLSGDLTLLFNFPKGLQFAYSACYNDNARISQTCTSRSPKLTSPIIKRCVCFPSAI